MFKFRVGLYYLQCAKTKRRETTELFSPSRYILHALALSVYWQRLPKGMRDVTWSLVPQNTRMKSVCLLVAFGRFRGGTAGELLSFHSQEDIMLKMFWCFSSHVNRNVYLIWEAVSILNMLIYLYAASILKRAVKYTKRIFSRF